MDEMKSKVYIKVDENGNILRVEGGYTLTNIDNISEWIYVDEGEGDKFNLCQTHYLDESIMDENGVYRYKYVDGEIIRKSDDEMADEYVEPVPVPTPTERMNIIEDAILELATLIAEVERNG